MMFWQVKASVFEQVEQYRDDNTNQYHRCNRYENPAVISLDPNIAWQFAKPVYCPWSELQQYAQYDKYCPRDD